MRYRPKIALFVAATALTNSPLTSAYQEGETIDPATLKRLGIAAQSTAVIDFFAEWCESCRKELPLISKLNAAIDDEVQFIGVDTDEDEAVAKEFQEGLRSQGALNFAVINDPDQSLVNTFKPMGFPALYIVHNGKVVSAHLGAISNIDQVIKEDLAKLKGAAGE